MNPLLSEHRIEVQNNKHYTWILAKYCDLKTDGGGTTLVTIKDRYSGKKLAQWGAFGFKVF